MSHRANPFVVLLDANVLFPFRTRDILLTFNQVGLFRARFTDQILEEWTGALRERRPELTESIEQQRMQIAEIFGECFVSGYEPLIQGLELPDDNDRHVLAAAIRCSAQLIITENLKDFPKEVLDNYGVEAISADDALAYTFDLFPADATLALRKVRERYKRPSFTRSDFLLDLTRSGLPKLAARARSYVDYL